MENFISQLKTVFQGEKSESNQKFSGYRTDHLATDGLRDTKLYIPRSDEIERILDTIQAQRNPILIDGDSGVGKTCLITKIKNSLREENEDVKIAEINTLALEPESLVRRTATDWGIDIEDSAPLDMLHEINAELDKNREYILIIDEASDFIEAKEKTEIAIILKSLINSRHDNGERKCNLILTGLPNTLDELGAKSETLKQRLLAGQITLGPLRFREAEKYVEKYLNYANVSPKKITRTGTQKIYERTDGIPRAINQVLLKIIQNLPKKHSKVPKINAEFVEKTMGKVKTPENPEVDLLTSFQKKVVKTVLEFEPQGIKVPELTTELKNKGNPTSRESVSSTCKKLMESNWVNREREGKTHRIRATSFTKNIFAKL